jgi:hypothetical protein
MSKRGFGSSVRISFLAFSYMLVITLAQAQDVKQAVPQAPVTDSDGDHVKERNAWFFRGRIIPGKPTAELRHRAYQTKVQMRAQRAAEQFVLPQTPRAAAFSLGSWTPLGPVPLASDASGTGVQDYYQVAGRATAVAIDPADPSGNTVYIGGAQGGVWKSTNAATTTAAGVTWTPVIDDQATLAVGAIAIQPGNSDPAKSVILVATGEANSSGDSYFGLGILRSTDAGNTWTLIPSANGGALSFSGLGGTRMAFATATTVVAAMAASSEGVVDGAVTSGTKRGLYTSLDAGQTWTYNALLDPGSQPTDATSATSVVYNATAGIFFAAIRYHGFYSSPDGITWTRLANQPSGALSTTACPPLSTANNRGCPIYRGEITVVPGRNEIYVWFINLDSSGNSIGEGIWRSLDAGASWTQISDGGIASCGDSLGCGVQQGYYNLGLMAVPNGSTPTDLYAGAINLYKCSINSTNPTCNTSGFINLTHVYGCNPIGAPAHVHPDQHALAYMIPTSGTDSGNALIYLANDGGIYRALNGFVGLNSGSCSATNQFDDLNQNLGSMAQFVSFSQHPTDPNTLLGGTQDNGSPATVSATTSTSWVNVNGGDGGFNAIDPGVVTNWYVSNPDIQPRGLNIQECSNGVNCREGNFTSVVGSNALGGDDGAFYFPYILDPRSSTALLVGTCRVWRGPRLGGAYTVLSPNFDTLGSGTCTGSEVNLVRALAAGGPTDSNGSQTVYVTTDGLGPLDAASPTGGHVWVTTNATAGSSAFAEVAQNINPSQFPISSVAIDTSDSTGNTAYVTVMGFTGGPGHIWQTTDTGATWTDFSGSGGTAMPDAPVNAVVVDTSTHTLYVGTDVGVFQSGTVSASWSELGPNPSSGQAGFLPNVAVTALAIFNSGGQRLLRASTYGRGIWQWNLVPDFGIAISNSPQTIRSGQTATFNGTVSALNGFNNSIALSCVAATTPPPSTCTPFPAVLFATTNTPFTVTASGAIGDYSFSVQGVGSDSKNTTHQASIILHIVTTSPDFILSEPSSFPTVNAGSSNTSGSINVAAINGFTGTVALACSLTSGNGSCSVSPASVSAFPATANVTVKATNLTAGSYQLSVQGISGSTTHTLAVPFNVGDYEISGTQSLTVAPGTQGTANLTITPSTFYAGSINATCDATALSGATCTLNPANPITVNGGSSVPLTATISVPSNAASGSYNININTQGTTGVPSHSLVVALTVKQDFSVASSTPSQTVAAGQNTGPYNLMVAPSPPGSLFSSAVSLSCSQGLPTGAQCNFTPNPVTPGNSPIAVVLTIATSTTTPAGTASVTVTATSGSISHLLTVTLIVTVPKTFQLAIGQAFPANVDAGAQPVPPTAMVTVTPSYNGSLNVVCDASAVSGATCALSPQSPVTITSGVQLVLTLTLNLPNSAAPNPTNAYNINLTVADLSGQPSQQLTLPLTVIQDFSVTTSPPSQSQTVTAGRTTGAYSMTVAPNPTGSSFSGAVTLACSNLPALAQCLFNPPTPVSLGSTSQQVVMNISTVATTASLQEPGNYRLILFAMWLGLPGIVIAMRSGRRPQLGKRWRLGPMLGLVLLALTLSSCGGTSSGGGGGGGHPGTPHGPYTISVTASSGTGSGTISHSTTVGLVVQ